MISNSEVTCTFTIVLGKPSRILIQPAIWYCFLSLHVFVYFMNKSLDRKPETSDKRALYQDVGQTNHLLVELVGISISPRIPSWRGGAAGRR
jgi:hypothetical protein